MQTMTTAGLFVLAALGAQAFAAAPPAPAPGENPWPSVLGSGLLTMPDTRTLAPGRFTAATVLHNRDRDPLGIDMFDYSLAVAGGVTPSIEVYAYGVFSRVVVVPDNSNTTPALPPPPLDLVVPRGQALPRRPYYALYAVLPYANGRGDQSFTDFVPGDLILGGKYRLHDGNGRWPSVAFSGDVKFPLTRRYSALESGSGTGSMDAALRLTADHRVAGFDAVLSAAFTYVGSPKLPDRIVIADDDRAEVLVQPLRLPHRMEIGLGLRRPLSRRFALVGEIVSNLDILDAPTEILDSAPPLDYLGGFQGRIGRLHVTLGILYHGRALPDGELRTSPLSGYADLSRATPDAIATYLDASGLRSAAGQLRPDVQIAAPMVPGVPLPEGARPIPEKYTISSQHQTGFVLNLGWSF